MDFDSAASQVTKFYESKDLKNWNFVSSFGEGIGNHNGVWECPDLFELQVKGTSKTKWVHLVSINPGGPNGGSATQYFVGDFDGSLRAGAITFTLGRMLIGLSLATFVCSQTWMSQMYNKSVVGIANAAYGAQEEALAAPPRARAEDILHC